MLVQKVARLELRDGGCSPETRKRAATGTAMAAWGEKCFATHCGVLVLRSDAGTCKGACRLASKVIGTYSWPALVQRIQNCCARIKCAAVWAAGLQLRVRPVRLKRGYCWRFAFKYNDLAIQ